MAEATEIGAIKARIELDATNFKRQMTDVRKTTQETAKQAQSTSASFAKLNESLSGVGASSAQIQRINDAIRKANPEILRKQIATVTEELRKLGVSSGEISKITDELEKSAKGASTAEKEVKALGAAYVALAIAIGGIITKSIEASAAFEQAMANVKAISQATGAEFEALRNQAIALGASTKFTAGQAADAQAELAQAGYKTRDVIAALPGVLALAAAGNTDLAMTADIASSALNSFGLQAKDSARVADVLAKAAIDTNANVTDLGMAIKYVGPVAASMGLSIEEAVAAIGELSNAGIKGEMAGTSLRAILLALSSPSKEAAGYLEQLNVTIADSAGKIRPFGDIISQFQVAFTKLTEAQQADAAATLVGREAASGFITLIKQGRATLDNYTEGLQNAGGTAQRVAGTQMDTLSGAAEQMRAAFESVGITIGDKFAPAVRGVAEEITRLLSGFSTLSPALQSAIIAFTTVTPLVAGAIAAIVALRAAIVALGIAIDVSLPIIGAISLAVGALAAGAAALIGKYEASRESAKKFAQAQKDLNDVLNQSPIKRTTSDIEDLRAKMEETTKVLQERSTIEQKIADQQDKRTSGVNALSAQQAKLRDLNAELKNVDQKLNDMGYSGVDQATKKLADMNRAINESVPALLAEKQAELQAVSAKVQHVDRMEDLRDRYVALSKLQSLDESQKAELLSTYQELRKEYPQIVGEMNKEGVVRVANIDIVNQQIQSEKDLVSTSATANKTFLENLRTTTQAQLVYVQARIDQYKRLEDAMKRVSGDQSSDSLAAERAYRRSSSSASGLSQDQITLQGALNDIDKQIASITSGTYKDIGSPVTETVDLKAKQGKAKTKKSTGKTPEQIAADLRKKAFDSDLASAKYMADYYSQNADTQIAALEAVRDKNKQYLEDNLDDARALNVQIKALNTSKTEDAKKAAKAQYDASAEWIDMEERRLREKGASESEVAQMQLDAWTRVKARYIEDTDEYKAADKALYTARQALIKETAESQKDADEARLKAVKSVTDAFEDAIDAEKKKELDSLDDLKKARKDYYDAQIKALDKSEKQRSRSEIEAEAEKYRLATSEAGQKHYADLVEKLRKMDVDDQKSTLEDARDAELSALDKRKDDIEDWYNDLKRSIDTFSGDVSQIYQSTEDSRFTAFVTTNEHIKAEMTKFQAEMARLSGLNPSSANNPTPTPEETATIAQMKANASAWYTSDDAGKARLQAENQRLGAQIGATYSNGSWTRNGLPLFHSGGIAGMQSFRSGSALMPDELTAILRQGEVTLTPAQISILAGAGGNGKGSVVIENYMPMSNVTFEDETDFGGFQRNANDGAAELLRKLQSGQGAGV